MKMAYGAHRRLGDAHWRYRIARQRAPLIISGAGATRGGNDALAWARAAVRTLVSVPAMRRRCAASSSHVRLFRTSARSKIGEKPFMPARVMLFTNINAPRYFVKRAAAAHRYNRQRSSKLAKSSDGSARSNATSAPHQESGEKRKSPHPC